MKFTKIDDDSESIIESLNFNFQFLCLKKL